MSAFQVLLSNIKEKCVTFYQPAKNTYYLGYRFWEGVPNIIDSPQGSYNRKPRSSIHAAKLGTKNALQVGNAEYSGKGWLTQYSEIGSAKSGSMNFQSFEDGSAQVELIEKDADLILELYFDPVKDGIRLQMKASAIRTITNGYCIQQCLRFTGSMNAKWRTKIAHVPYLSELDMHAMGRPNATLTFGRRSGNWIQMPVEHTVVPINLVDENTTSKTVFDHGLIVRESPHRSDAPGWYWERVAPQLEWDQVSAGMYWERTAMVSNRHPADCVHAWVDLGPIQKGESRIIHGKVYYLGGSKEDLLSAWEKDFIDNF